ncbi:hypothetical protein ARSEF1564_008850 [Beauveria bassiana]
MDPSSRPEETPLDEPADTLADVPDDAQSTSSQAQDEPRVIVEHLISTSNQPQTPQELPSPGDVPSLGDLSSPGDVPSPEDLPSPENVPTPSYTFDIQSALAAVPLSPVAEDEEEEDLYTDDRESFKTASKSGRQSSSPEREHVENSEEPHGVGLTKAPDDRRLAQQDVKAEHVRQLRYAPSGSSYQARLAKQGGPILPQLPPSYYDAAMSLSRMKESTLDQFGPIRQARVSELRELRPIAPIHNGRAAEREDDNVERADTPAPYASPPKRTLFGSILDWTKSLVKENVDGKGRWLCSVCTVFLNTMNPHDRDRRVVERMHQTLGIWPPFKRVPKVTVATRICARCHQSTNCVLFAYYEAD